LNLIKVFAEYEKLLDRFIVTDEQIREALFVENGWWSIRTNRQSIFIKALVRFIRMNGLYSGWPKINLINCL